MQRAVSNGWLNPDLIAFAEEQHALRGRQRGLTPRTSVRARGRTMQTRGKHQPGRSKNGLTLRLSVFGLLLSSAAFSYFAWSNSLGALPVASVIGRALGSTDSANTSVVAGANDDTSTKIFSPNSDARDSLAPVISGTDTVQLELKEQVYHLRAENHALQMRLSKLREQMDEVEGALQSDYAKPADSEPSTLATIELASATPGH